MIIDNRQYTLPKDGFLRRAKMIVPAVISSSAIATLGHSVVADAGF